MEKNKTALEMFVEQLPIRIKNSYYQEIEQAIEMEKEQITDAYTMGSYDLASQEFDPEKYYNETYKKPI